MFAELQFEASRCFTLWAQWSANYARAQFIIYYHLYQTEKPGHEMQVISEME